MTMYWKDSQSPDGEPQTVLVRLKDRDQGGEHEVARLYGKMSIPEKRKIVDELHRIGDITKDEAAFLHEDARREGMQEMIDVFEAGAFSDGLEPVPIPVVAGKTSQLTVLKKVRPHMVSWDIERDGELLGQARQTGDGFEAYVKRRMGEKEDPFLGTEERLCDAIGWCARVLWQKSRISVQELKRIKNWAARETRPAAPVVHAEESKMELSFDWIKQVLLPAVGWDPEQDPDHVDDRPAPALFMDFLAKVKEDQWIIKTQQEQITALQSQLREMRENPLIQVTTHPLDEGRDLVEDMEHNRLSMTREYLLHVVLNAVDIKPDEVRKFSNKGALSVFLEKVRTLKAFRDEHRKFKPLELDSGVKDAVERRMWRLLEQLNGDRIRVTSVKRPDVGPHACELRIEPNYTGYRAGLNDVDTARDSKFDVRENGFDISPDMLETIRATIKRYRPKAMPQEHLENLSFADFFRKEYEWMTDQLQQFREHPGRSIMGVIKTKMEDLTTGTGSGRSAWRNQNLPRISPERQAEGWEPPAKHLEKQTPLDDQSGEEFEPWG